MWSRYRVHSTQGRGSIRNATYAAGIVATICGGKVSPEVALFDLAGRTQVPWVSKEQFGRPLGYLLPVI